MRDLLSWNVYLGRVAGVQIRLHAFFILLLVAALAVRQEVLPWYSFSAIALLFFSVVWHEAAHCIVALRTGGTADHVLLWPLGGLVQVNTSAHDPQQDWPTAIAGILASLAICAFALPILLLTGSGSWLQFNPFALPPIDDELTWRSVLALLFWTNWILLLANLLPAFPFDGARLLRTALWPRLGYRTASLQVVRAAKLTALTLFVLGLIVHQQYPAALMILSVLSLLVFFAARHEIDKLQDTDSEERVFGYDFSQGYTSLERATGTPAAPKLNFLRRWLKNRHENRLRRRREVEELEDLRVDDVLARLHEAGVDGLSSEDRALLQRVSQRYRNRHRT
jgi:Zn-dependent protease